MGRNIVVCCDGTANQFSQDNTNVVKLYSALVDDAARQLIFYHPGVGTMEAPGALTSWGQRATIFAGMAVGYGLERDITAAYTFIMNNYKASEGDRLFLFGFSRGAYTVRAIASLLRSCGILRPGHETSIPYAIRLMNAIGTSQTADQSQGGGYGSDSTQVAGQEAQNHQYADADAAAVRDLPGAGGVRRVAVR